MKTNTMKTLLIVMVLVLNTTGIFAQKATQKKAHNAKATYTCPMHPDVISSKPGKCSKCGMQLVVRRTSSKQLEKIVYTCGMHPEVVSDAAGRCPVCGMQLVKKKHEKKAKSQM